MKRVAFVGQAMPRRKLHPHDWPSLGMWLHSINIADHQIKENFLYSALVDYFPGTKNGSHLIPTEIEIQMERDRLKNDLVNFRPEIVVPVGRLSIAYCLNVKLQPLYKFIGRSFIINPYNLLDQELQIIPFPHPSGASTWTKTVNGRKLLSEALELLKENLI